jgi:hypothetical protein
LGLGVAGLAGGFTASGTGVGALVGVPVAELSFALAVHGTLVLGAVAVREAVYPLPPLHFAASNGGGGRKTPIYGNPQKGTTPEHNAKVDEIAEKLASSGHYEVIWKDKQILIATEYRVPGRGEPDVLALNFTNKTAHIVEVPSPSQIVKPGRYTNEFLRGIEMAENAFKSKGWTVTSEIIEP